MARPGRFLSVSNSVSELRRAGKLSANDGIGLLDASARVGVKMLCIEGDQFLGDSKSLRGGCRPNDIDLEKTCLKQGLSFVNQ